MALQKEYQRQVGEVVGQFKPLPHSPYRAFFYSRDYVLWLEKQLISLRDKTAPKKH